MEMEFKKKKRNTAHAGFHLLRFSKRIIKFGTAIFEETEKNKQSEKNQKSMEYFTIKRFPRTG